MSMKKFFSKKFTGPTFKTIKRNQDEYRDKIASIKLAKKLDVENKLFYQKNTKEKCTNV